MPKIFDIYRFYALTEPGETWYPGFDKRNMTTAENQSSALYRFVGPGIIDGWDVETLNSEIRSETVSQDDLDERSSLIDAASGSFLANNYKYLDYPTIDDELAWAQIVRVTPGEGIVGQYPAETVQTCYFRLTAPDFVYYAWAEAGLCIIESGRANISIPADGDIDYDLTTTATYLATIETIQYEDDPTQGYIYSIDYESKRKILKNLEGALDEALRKSFYRHVHLGGTDHPSQINLSTSLILLASGPVGSTILDLNYNDELFTWDEEDYGIPIVHLNDEVLASDNYVISPSSGRISLTNSLVDGDALTVTLPLASQIRLTIPVSACASG